MTRDERRQALHVLIDQHAEILQQLRLATAEVVHINEGHDAAVAGFRQAGQAISRMAAAHEVAITAGLSVLDAALKLLDEERGVM